MSLHESLSGIPQYRRSYVRRLIGQIKSKAEAIGSDSNDELYQKHLELRFRAKGGESPRNLIVEAFALVQEASQRTLGMRHYDVQLMAGINLVSRCIVEMATGEGKTLTALLPLYLYGLYGKGAKLATANDYLARRDGEEMRPVFEMFGMSLGIIQDKSNDEDRKLAYESDITYGTLTQFGFDFLRDRMKRRLIKGLSMKGDINDSKMLPQTVCRKLHFVLIDEADSIMIDDASTPLIIGAFVQKKEDASTRLYQWAANHAPTAREKIDYQFIDHRDKIELTERGRNWARESALNTEVATLPTVDLYEYVERAIKVERDYFRDRNYVINGNEVTIVDENTGRLAQGRFWQDGLHQAIQAREGIDITLPTSSAARLTVQSLVLSYPIRAGMTGTAKSSRKEFRKVYKMNVVSIPTHKPCRRKKQPTVYSPNQELKLATIARRVRLLQESGKPVLLGCRSVEKSERLSAVFQEWGIEHKVLNARHEEQEAAIIAEAGRGGNVTISTSMAGRGTDIKITDEVARLGGLHVLLTELNDSKRIDRQLIGRCARQGDPGVYQIFLAPDDHVMEAKNKTGFWLRCSQLASRIHLLSIETCFHFAQAKVTGKKTRERLAMLDQEKKRLRALRQAGLDPVLDVID